MYIVVQLTIVWKPFWQQEMVSIFVLTKGEVGERFFDIMIIALFICLCMWFCIFYYFNNLFIKQAGNLDINGTWGFIGYLGAVNVKVLKKWIINTKNGCI
jgi:hypothetical protein